MTWSGKDLRRRLQQGLRPIPDRMNQQNHLYDDAGGFTHEEFAICWFRHSFEACPKVLALVRAFLCNSTEGSSLAASAHDDLLGATLSQGRHRHAWT
jgi:hypothetical protein